MALSRTKQMKQIVMYNHVYEVAYNIKIKTNWYVVQQIELVLDTSVYLQQFMHKIFLTNVLV